MTTDTQAPLPLDTERAERIAAFSALRAAVRMAIAAGFRREPITRTVQRIDGTASAAGGWRRTDWRGPYAYSIIAAAGEDAPWHAVELTAPQRAVFGDARYLWRTSSDGARFEYDSGRYEPETNTCEHCSHVGPTDDEWSEVYYRTARGRTESAIWCADCASDTYYCERSDRTWRSDDVTTVDGETVSCVWAEENAYYHEGDGEYHFEPEREESDDDSPADDDGTIYRYGTNVLRRHSWPGETATDALCFGVELETEPGDNSYAGQHALAEALGGRNGHNGELGGAYILAADGSLDCGVEIITVPQTLEQHHTGRRIPWRKVAHALKDVGAKAGAGTKNCGMHVHINRKALSALTVGKMLVLINSPTMQRFVELVAQRSATSYCRRTAKKVTDALRPEDNNDHYDALNIGTEHGTLELRIFRGNTRHSRIMKNLEFCHALCIYCRDASIRDIEDPAKMRAWIAARAGAYPNLSKFLNDNQSA